MLNWIKIEFNRTYAVGDSQCIKWTNQVHADVHTCPNMPVHAVLKEALISIQNSALVMDTFSQGNRRIPSGVNPKTKSFGFGSARWLWPTRTQTAAPLTPSPEAVEFVDWFLQNIDFSVEQTLMCSDTPLSCSFLRQILLDP
ncbi:unnamed protein product [Chondrus crispus]|uniref:Uncharacterized protein n=1 Tax=Chondrus crispus TaxID=2769 RepID=R7QCY5_CHOCR|nr:unnamed protein product [Chondrus crispus]CDF36367.1 unnamed protein product [Chondrus crispus]|eukprot:XP_005716186.1 unnamed protein product [Chondrus crispus]